MNPSHQYKHLWCQQGRQRGYSLWTGIRLEGRLYHSIWCGHSCVHLKRTVGEIEHAFSSHAGNVLYMRSGFMYTRVLSRRLQHCQPGRTTSTTVMVVLGR